MIVGWIIENISLHVVKHACNLHVVSEGKYMYCSQGCIYFRAADAHHAVIRLVCREIVFGIKNIS